VNYLLNDQLSTILPNWKGNPIKGKEFQYLDRSFRPEWSTVFKMLITSNPQREEKKNDDWRPNTHTGIDHFSDKSQDWILWLGHASFVIQLGGVRMITDPVLFDLPLLSRKVHLPFEFKYLQEIDYVLLSHDHRDHCDEKSMKRLLENNDPVILTALKMTDVIGSWIEQTPVQEAAWYQRYNTDHRDLQITYLPAQHWCRRGLTDFNRRLWGSIMIEHQGKTIYFGADSATGSHFRKIGKLFPKIDIAMLGIGAYKPEFMMKDNHTSPSEAYAAFQQLGAKQMIPMHYGTYDLSNEPISEPYQRIQECFIADDRREDLILAEVNQVIPL
jgi:L-ascorbate metabolism protein UlaG (beta-lactamase superfamily)